MTKAKAKAARENERLEDEIDREIFGEFERTIRKHYGERCRDYDENCPCCRAYELFDRFKKGLMEI